MLTFTSFLKHNIRHTISITELFPISFLFMVMSNFTADYKHRAQKQSGENNFLVPCKFAQMNTVYFYGSFISVERDRISTKKTQTKQMTHDLHVKFIKIQQ